MAAACASSATKQEANCLEQWMNVGWGGWNEGSRKTGKSGIGTSMADLSVKQGKVMGRTKKIADL
jgi:hypothetical protein